MVYSKNRWLSNRLVLKKQVSAKLLWFYYTVKLQFLLLVIQDNVLDCLDELGLAEFRCLLRGSDLEIALQDEDKDFTVFALTNETIVDVDLERLGDEYLEEALSAHVINKQLQTLDFKDGQRFETLVDQCFVHVTEIGKTYSDWNTYKQKSVSSIAVS